MNALRLAVVLSLVAAFGWGCSGSGLSDDELLQLSSEEALEIGQKLMGDKKYFRARSYLTHAFEVSPNSRSGREALLLVADSHFLEGGQDNFIKAEAKYRDFQNRFPTTDRADYIQFQIGKSLANRLEQPDRDQVISLEALDAFETLMRLYPTSQYVAAAQEDIQRINDRLGQHEYMIGRFYMRFNLPAAAVQRFEYLVENYPGFDKLDAALYYLGVSYQRANRNDKAEEAFARLRSEFPDSEWVSRVPASTEEEEEKETK